MKQIGVILIAFSFFFYACSKPSKQSELRVGDTTKVLKAIYSVGGAGWTGASVRFFGQKARKFYDSTSACGVWGIDSIPILLIPNSKDTIKDKQGKYLYDSATHQLQFNFHWYKLNDAERQTVKVQIINI